MSRYSVKDENPYIEFHFGNDHAIGKFFDITDSRYASSGFDEQGEGYVFEWSELFGIGNNLIGAKVEDLEDRNKLIELTNQFIENLKKK